MTETKIASLKTYTERQFLSVFAVLLVTILADAIIGMDADIFVDFTTSVEGISIFVLFAFIYIFGQWYIFRNLNEKTKLGRGRTQFHSISNIVRIVQYLLIGIMIIVVLQIVLSSQYFSSLLSAATAISYGLATYLMTWLAYRFFRWYVKKRSLVLLIYGLAAAAFAVNAADSIILNDVDISRKAAMITPNLDVTFETNFELPNPMFFVTTVQATSLIAYFALTWGGTVLLLHHNIKRIGRLKFWALVIPPILFMLGSYVATYQTINPPPEIDTPFLPLIIAVSCVIAASVFFGLGFFSVARSLQGYLRNYMLITGCGFILLFNAAMAPLLQAGYPPFGLVSVSFIGLTSFMVVTGLYRSAVSIAEDVSLRRSVRKSMEKLGLLDSMGQSQVTEQIEKM